MKMEMQGGLALALVLGAVTLGWGEAAPGERLAMTVHHQYADPGEEGVEWTKQFFVDETGRLVRITALGRGGTKGDPEEVKDTVFRWDGRSVRWEGASGKGQILLSPGRLTLSLTGQDGNSRGSDYRWTIPFRGEWSDGRYRYKWTKERGYQGIPIDERMGPEQVHAPSVWMTEGSRIVTLREGKLWEFLLLNRSPSSLEGTYYGNLIEGQGWVAVGKTTLAGTGLWNPDESVRLAHAVVLSLETPGDLWPAFVFEEKYLK